MQTPHACSSYLPPHMHSACLSHSCTRHLTHPRLCLPLPIAFPTLPTTTTGTDPTGTCHLEPTTMPPFTAATDVRSRALPAAAPPLLLFLQRFCCTPYRSHHLPPGVEQHLRATLCVRYRARVCTHLPLRRDVSLRAVSCEHMRHVQFYTTAFQFLPACRIAGFLCLCHPNLRAVHYLLGSPPFCLPPLVRTIYGLIRSVLPLPPPAYYLYYRFWTPFVNHHAYLPCRWGCYSSFRVYTGSDFLFSGLTFYRTCRCRYLPPLCLPYLALLVSPYALPAFPACTPHRFGTIHTLFLPATVLRSASCDLLIEH